MQKRVGVALATLVVAALILVWRKFDAVANPQFVAEDGVLFFATAYQLPPFHAWFVPAAGYLHLLPRIIADVALLLDPLWIPSVYAFGALALNLWVVVVLFSPRLDLPLAVRAALALGYVLVPHTGEVLVSLTNLQWTLAAVLVILLLLRDAQTNGERARDYGTVTLIGLTGPFLVFLSPLFLARAVQRRTRESVQFAAVAMAIALVQVIFLVRDQAVFARSTPIDLGLLLPVMSARIFGTLWGAYGIPILTPHGGWVAVGIVGMLLFAALALWPGRWRDQRLMIAASFVLLTLPVAVKFLREAVVLRGPHNGDRYFFQPHLMLVWLLILGAWMLPRGWRWAAAGALAAMVVFNLPHYQAAPLKDYQWERYVADVRQGKPLQIPIHPEWTIKTGRAARR